MPLKMVIFYFLFTGFTLLSAEKTQVGTLNHKPIKECSGIVASRQFPGVFWIHNDSGNKPYIYAVKSDGELINEFAVAERNIDWEDIALDNSGNLFIADIGNNTRRERSLLIHQFEEPDPYKRPSEPLQPEKTWTLHYPHSPFDAEALFINKSNAYIISKHYNATRASLYHFILDDERDTQTLKKISRLTTSSPVTAADISADGSQLSVLTNTGVLLYSLTKPLNKIGSLTPYRYRFIKPTAEACTLTQDGVLVATENRKMHLFSFEKIKSNGKDYPEPMLLPITQLNKAITIDGSFKDWPVKTADLPSSSTTLPKADFRAAWSDNGLYIAASIPDDTLKPVEKAWYYGDCVEFFWGSNKPERSPRYQDGDYRCYIGFTQEEKGRSLTAKLFWPRDKKEVKRGVIYALNTQSERHYQLELFIPKELFPCEQWSAGSTFRFNISALSDEPENNWYISSSNQAGTWSSPLMWAIATLQSE